MDVKNVIAGLGDDDVGKHWGLLNPKKCEVLVLKVNLQSLCVNNNVHNISNRTYWFVLSKVYQRRLLVVCVF